MPGIIWLASYPKSGNTWVRAFLANLMTDARQAVPINALPNHLLGDNFLIHYEKLAGKPAGSLTEADIERLRPRVHEWFAYSRSDNVFVKTHNAAVKIEGRPLITPTATAGAIYVIRNPLDVAVSFAHHYKIDYQRAVESLCDTRYYLPASSDQCVQVLSSWSNHVRSWADAPGLPLLTLRYEDLLKKPAATFGSLVSFLQLPRDRPRLRRAIKFSSFGELRNQERKETFVEARPDGTVPFFRSGKAGGWREVLTERQADRLITAHEEILRRFDYLTPEGDPRF